MSEISILAIDLAKGSFQVCGVKTDGSVVFNKSVSLPRLYQLLAEQAHCVVAMEACVTSHHWGRVAQSYGHEVRLIPAAYVKPLVKLCSPQHNFTYHQVPIMRRNVRRSANFRRFGSKFLRIILDRHSPSGLPYGVKVA